MTRIDVYAHASRIFATRYELYDMGHEIMATSCREDWLEVMPRLEREISAADRALDLLEALDPIAYLEAFGDHVPF